jgi:hypothetical protein
VLVADGAVSRTAIVTRVTRRIGEIVEVRIRRQRRQVAQPPQISNDTARTSEPLRGNSSATTRPSPRRANPSTAIGVLVAALIAQHRRHERTA